MGSQDKEIATIRFDLRLFTPEVFSKFTLNECNQYLYGLWATIYLISWQNYTPAFSKATRIRMMKNAGEISCSKPNQPSLNPKQCRVNKNCGSRNCLRSFSPTSKYAHIRIRLRAVALRRSVQSGRV